MTNEITVSVYEHKTLNSYKVVVFCRDAKGDSDDDILKTVSHQGITEVHQITKGGNKIPTGIFVLSVKGSKPPKEVKLGYTILKTPP